MCLVPCVCLDPNKWYQSEVLVFWGHTDQRQKAEKRENLVHLTAAVVDSGRNRNRNTSRRRNRHRSSSVSGLSQRSLFTDCVLSPGRERRTDLCLVSTKERRVFF